MFRSSFSERCDDGLAVPQRPTKEAGKREREVLRASEQVVVVGDIVDPRHVERACKQVHDRGDVRVPAVDEHVRIGPSHGLEQARHLREASDRRRIGPWRVPAVERHAVGPQGLRLAVVPDDEVDIETVAELAREQTELALCATARERLIRVVVPVHRRTNETDSAPGHRQ